MRYRHTLLAVLLLAGSTLWAGIPIHTSSGKLTHPPYDSWSPTNTGIPPDAIVWEAYIPGTIDINAVASLKGGTLVGDTVKWTRTFEDYDRDAPHSLYGCVPMDMQDVQLDFSITSSGFFRMVAHSLTGDTARLLVTLGLWRGCVENPYGSLPYPGWDERTPGDTLTALYNPYADFLSGGVLNVNPQLVWIARLEFGHIVVNGAYSGPIQRALYEWRTYFIDSSRVRMYSTFTKPLWIVAQVLFHEQADYSWYPRERRPLDLERNSRFSVAPSGTWDLTFSAKKGFNYSFHGSVKTVAVANANNDNWDESAVRLNGGDLAGRQDCCSQDGFSLSAPPDGAVEISGYTVWSWMAPTVWLVGLADSVSILSWWEERDGQMNPSDSWDQNPPPMILKITPDGAVAVKEAFSHHPAPVAIRVTVRNGRIAFQSPRPVSFEVFDVMGRRVGSVHHRVRSGSVRVNGPGMYLWRAGDQIGKVLIP